MIEDFIMPVLNFLISIIITIFGFIESITTEWFFEVVLAMSLLLSYLLAKSQKFSRWIGGDLGLTLVLTLLIFIIFYLIKIGGGF